MADIASITGLPELIRSPEYRTALGLPETVTETYRLLAQGEYNINYRFVHPVTGQALLLRVNNGSQMHLEHQIEYESHALDLLEPSGRTPRILYVDGSKRYTDHGISVMEYLPGRPLDYRTDLDRAARILADIHSVAVPDAAKQDGSAGASPRTADLPPQTDAPQSADLASETGTPQHAGLLAPADPVRAILEECEEMLSVYLGSDLPAPEKKAEIRSLLDLAWDRYRRTDLSAGARCIVNTELNSTNFLMAEGSGEAESDGTSARAADTFGAGAAAGRDYLIDWEKPLWSDPAQDIAHFLVPTTTFWKTDVILTQQETDGFLEAYEEAVRGRIDLTGLRERLGVFMPVTCMRGVTWCAMAWVQYQEPGRLISNESTWKKLGDYLSDAFLAEIRRIEEA